MSGEPRGLQIIFIVALAGLAIAIASANPAEAATWKFLVYGDSRGNGTDPNSNYDNGVDTQVLGALAQQTVAEHPAFVLFPGDLVSSVSTSDTTPFDTWQSTMQPVYDAGIGVCPVAGNHDTGNLANFKARFITPLQASPFAGAQNVVIDSTSSDGRSYSFRYGNALFLGLDNYANGSINYHRVNQGFVNDRLAARNPAATPLVFAFDHEPAFRAGPDTSLEAYPNQRNDLWNSLKAAGCRDFFAGHDHIYARAALRDNPDDGNLNNDINQVVVGTGGAPHATTAYSGNTGTWTVDQAFNDDDYFGYLRVEIDDTARTVTHTWVEELADGSFQDTAETYTYSYAVVPEPGGLALAGMALAVLVGHRLRRSIGKRATK
jgi:hypothetical protein